MLNSSIQIVNDNRFARLNQNCYHLRSAVTFQGVDMNKTTTCTIRLLGKTYEIKCPENETDSLEAAALKLNTHMLDTKNQFKQLDSYQTLLLAALQVSHELVKSQKKQEEHQQQLTQFINSLENKISEASADSMKSKNQKTGAKTEDTPS